MTDYDVYSVIKGLLKLHIKEGIIYKWQKVMYLDLLIYIKLYKGILFF